MIRLCPKCDERLFLLHFHDIEVDACQKCRGVWLDAGELEQIMRDSGAAPDDTLVRALEGPSHLPPGRKNMCPRCDEALQEIEISCADGSTIALDLCSSRHGIWFDQGELVGILRAFPESCCASKTIDYLNEMLADFLTKRP